MENLINFDENENNVKNLEESANISENAIKHPLLVSDRLSIELNNPFDKLEYKITHSDDPFECVFLATQTKKVCNSEKDKTESSDKSSKTTNSKDNILNSTAPLPAESMTSNSSIINDSESSISSKNKTFKRCQSDSSTEATIEGGTKSRFNSMDNVSYSKTNQLLKLSLLNSPNFPLHSSSRNTLDGSLNEGVLLEAKKISDKLKDFNEMSFEDLDNISQQLVDVSNISVADPDLEQLKISFLENNPEMSESKDFNKSDEKIEDIQEKLKKIKEEKNKECKIKTEALEISEKVDETSKTPDKECDKEEEMEDVFQKIKELMKDNKREEAKKQMQKLNEMLGISDSNHLQVQPMVRQDTFEIDKSTGHRKYLNNSTSDENDVSSNGELMEQLAKLFGAQSLDVGSLNLSNGSNSETTKYVVILPNVTPAVTPVKQTNPTRRSVSFSTQRPSTTHKNIENKKLSTPMKPSTTATSNAVRRSSFTAPRSVTNKQLHPYEQKLNIGTVRKSLMVAMDKSPTKLNSSALPKQSMLPPSSTANVRRSTSLKANLPSVKISEASPSKNRPTTSTSSKMSNVSKSNLSTNRRLSTFSSRPPTADQTHSNVRTATRKPIVSSKNLKILSSKESLV